jgi:iron complex outermembrane receptor protein
LRTAYDFDFRGETAEAIVSGPLSDDWGARLAVRLQHDDGAFKNLAPGASQGRVEQLTDSFGRFTLKGKINDRLDVRAKIAYGNTNNSGGFSIAQSFYCPTAPAAFDDCVPDHTTLSPDASPAAAALSPLNRVGHPLDRVQTIFATFEANYDLGDMTITNIVGLNDFWRAFVSVDPNSISPFGQNFLVGSKQGYSSITEELRLTSHFEGPFQFMVGGFYQHVRNNFDVDITVPFALIAETGDQTIHTDAYSFFAQASYDILPGLNVSGGARFTQEDKRGDGDKEGFGSPVFTPVYRDLPLNADNISPEATVTWKPEEELTFYGSYKEGFKSGGYNAVAVLPSVPPPPGTPLTFKPEHISGFEIGGKSLLLNQQLAVDLAAFSYIYRNLQVSTFDPVTHDVETINAASAKTQGIEADLTWVPEQFEGLRFNASIAYLDAHFKQYLATCYSGQSIAAGCDQNFSGGRFQSQNAAGKELINAPDVSANIGATYEGKLSDDWRYGVSIAEAYKDTYNPSDKLYPTARQGASWLLDASARVFSDDGHWEFAVIGRNLTDVFRANFAAEVTDLCRYSFPACVLPGANEHGTGTASTIPQNLYGAFGEPQSIAVRLTWRY